MQNSSAIELEEGREFGMETDNDPGIPQIFTVVRRTWLSRPPDPSAQAMTAAALFLLILACSAQWHNFYGLGEFWPATKNQVFNQGEYWRLWTTLFTHGDLGHLLANSLLFYILGYFLYGYFGGFVFPFSAWFMGGVINAVSIFSYAPDIRLVGASGMVSWMGGAWLALYFLLNTKISTTQRGLRSLGVALMLFAPSEAFDPKISYRTHMIGLFLGIACGYLYYIWRKKEFTAAEYRETVIE
jgi:rhomboid protease GluP